MNKLALYNQKNSPQDAHSDLRVGWTVRISQKVTEGTKAKNTSFEGIIVSRKHGNRSGSTITVRKVSGGIGIEKTLPLQLPSIEKIEVLRKSRVRRAKLYYLKEKSAKEIRKKTRIESAHSAALTPEETPVPAAE